jgi:hypothetical protein
MSRNGIDHRHCKWPLGLKVMVKTEQGYMEGRIHKNDSRAPHKAWVTFPVCVTMQGRDDNGRMFKLCQCCTEPHARFGHVIPFRNMKPLPGQVRPDQPWYRLAKAH